MKDKIRKIKFARLSRPEQLLYKIENNEIYIKFFQPTIEGKYMLYSFYFYQNEYIIETKYKKHKRSREDFLELLTLFLNDTECQKQEIKYNELNQ